MLGNLEADETRGPGGPWAGRAVDWVDVAWHECGRVLRKTSRAGRAVRVLLPPGQRLRHGDVLIDEGEGGEAAAVVAVNVVPCELIVVRPPDARAMAELALELGNLHWPAQVTTAEVMFVEDGPALAVARRMRLAWSVEVRRFAPLWSAAAKVRLADGFNVTRT